MIRSKKKILFMIDSLEGGGAERILSYLLRGMDRSLFDLHLLAVIGEGIYLNEIPDDVTVKYIFKSRWSQRYKPVRNFYRLYRRSRLEMFKLSPSLLSLASGIRDTYDVGISFCEGHNTPLLWLKRKHFIHTVSWIHVDLRTHRTPLKRENLEHHLGSIDRFFFVSEDARLGFLEACPSVKETSRLEVVYNPVETTRILQESRSATISKQQFTVLAIGRLTVQKRFDKLISVHKRLLDKGIKHEVRILGEGPDRTKLETQIRQLGVEKSCHLEGFKNPYPYLAMADVFIMTSDYEGLPVALCEAMVLGKPIISTRVTGPRELLEDGRYGLLVDNTEEAIETGLEKMITDKHLRELYKETLQQSKGFIFPTDLKCIENKLLEL